MFSGERLKKYKIIPDLKDYYKFPISKFRFSDKRNFICLTERGKIMSLEEALRQLGKEIQADERFKTLQAAADANDKDEDLQKKMKDLQLISLKYQQEATKGDEADQDKIDDLQNQYQDMYNEVMRNVNMITYSAAAMEVEQMAKYISGMIGQFFDGKDPETCELPPEQYCTHDCSTCGGCGF